MQMTQSKIRFAVNFTVIGAANIPSLQNDICEVREGAAVDGINERDMLWAQYALQGKCSAFCGKQAIFSKVKLFLLKSSIL